MKNLKHIWNYEKCLNIQYKIPMYPLPSFIIYQHLANPSSVTSHSHCHLTSKCETLTSLHFMWLISIIFVCIWKECVIYSCSVFYYICVHYIKLLIMVIKIYPFWFLKYSFWCIFSYPAQSFNPQRLKFCKVIMCSCVIQVQYIVCVEKFFFCGLEFFV